MNIQIRGDHHLDVTPALKQYVEKKMGRMERYLEASQVHDVSVTMSVTRGVHTVEVMIPLGQALLRAEERSDDMYASVDLVMDKLEKQLEKYRHRMGQKVSRRLKVEGGKAKTRVNQMGMDELAEEDEPDVVRVKRFDMKPMDVSEAIMQMDLLGHDFFVFANAEDEKTSVVYRRRNGQFGLIQAL